MQPPGTIPGSGPYWHMVSEVKLGLWQLFNFAKIRWAEVGQSKVYK